MISNCTILYNLILSCHCNELWNSFSKCKSFFFFLYVYLVPNLRVKLFLTMFYSFSMLVCVNGYQRYQAYNLIRRTRFSSTLDSSLTLRSKKFKSQKSTKLKNIVDQKFQKVVPNTAKLIYTYDNTVLD